MKRILGMLITMAAGALAVGLLASHAFAAGPMLSLSDGAGSPGAQVTVDLSTSGIGAPGLGAWSIDVAYDPRVVSAVSCMNPSNQIAVCNPNFTSNSVRISGASAAGIMGDFALGTITFKCGTSAGQTALTLRPRDFMDATPGNLMPIDVTLIHGSIACGVVLPATGNQGPTSGNPFVALIAALLAFGVVATASGTLLGRRSS